MANKNNRKRNLITVLIFILLISMSLNIFAEDAGTESKKGLMVIIQDSVASWYFIFRYFSIALMLVILIYLGIRLAISSLADDKAKYKRLLFDWLVGFIIIFTIHYFMILILNINDTAVNFIKDVSTKLATDDILTDEEKLLGLKPSTQGLYETIRTRAYELRFSIGTSGMIMYMVLVYYTVRFVIIYFKRFFTVLILTLMAPLMGLFYAFNKINSGKSAILTKWAEEYAFNVLLQTIHALMYGCFVQLALIVSTESIAGFILALILLNFMMKAEGIFRKIFKFSASIADDNNRGIRENLAGLTALKASAGAMFGGQIAKDAGAAMKRGAETVANSAVIAGAGIYNKYAIGEKFNKELEEKKKEKEKLDKELIQNSLIKETDNSETENGKNNTYSKEEREEKLAKRQKLEEEIQKMEDKKEKFANKYKGGIKDPEKLERKINATISREEIDKGRKLTREEKEKIAEKVREENKEKILRRKVEIDERTGKKEITYSVLDRLKGDINEKFWGSNAVKNGMKDMRKTATTGIRGVGEILIGMPLIVTEPSAGFALLAKGIKDADKLFGDSEYRKITTFNERNSIRKIQNKKRKQNRKLKRSERKNKKYTVNSYNPHSLATIEYALKMDQKLNSVRNTRITGIANFALTTPLRLIGIPGAVRTLQTKAYKIEEAKRDYSKRAETFMVLQRKDSMGRQQVSLYNKSVENIRNNVGARLAGDTILRYKKDAGKIYTVGESIFKFNNDKVEFGKNVGKNDIEAETKTEEEKKDLLSQKAILDNVILEVAVKNRVFDIEDLNLENDTVRQEIVEGMQEVGLADIIMTPEEVEIQLNEIEQRIQEISKNNPNAVEEKLAKEIIIEYMQEKGITDEEEIKKVEHREVLKKEIIKIIETEEQRREEILRPNTEETENTENFEFSQDTENFETPEIVKPAETLEKRKGIIALKLEERVKKIEKKEKRENREAALESLINSIEKVDKAEAVSEEISALEVTDNALYQEIERITLKEKTEKIDKPLQAFEEFLRDINKQRVENAFETINPIPEEEMEENVQRAIREHIEDNNLDEDNILLRNLLSILEQDKIAIELGIRPEDKERKRLEAMDFERINNTYKKEYMKGSQI